jgi:hypothetical protein
VTGTEPSTAHSGPPVMLALLAVVVVLITVVPSCGKPSLAAPCGRSTAVPARYDHVVVLVEENRSWNGIGLGFNASAMPFLHGLAAKCSYYPTWDETNRSQNSLTQYIGLTSGVDNPATVNDCQPSTLCHSTDNNIFRQVRNAAKTPRTYVEGPTTGCSATGNRAKHIPALYYWGGTDQNYCFTEVRPLNELDPNRLPTYAMIIPNLCNDGHDCTDPTVDSFARRTLTPILNGSNYAAGKTLVVVVYDEDRQVPNLLIAPTANARPITSVGGSHAALLKTIELGLGLPVMPQGQLPAAISLRPSAHL